MPVMQPTKIGTQRVHYCRLLIRSPPPLTFRADSRPPPGTLSVDDVGVPSAWSVGNWSERTEARVSGWSMGGADDEREGAPPRATGTEVEVEVGADGAADGALLVVTAEPPCIPVANKAIIVIDM